MCQRFRNVLLTIAICICMIAGCTEKDSANGHNKTLGDYIIEDLMDD